MAAHDEVPASAMRARLAAGDSSNDLLPTPVAKLHRDPGLAPGAAMVRAKDGSDDALAVELRHLEELLLRTDVRADAVALAALLCEEFREFGASGKVYTRAEIIAALTTESAGGILTLEEFALERLSPDAALATYRSIRTEPHDLSGPAASPGVTRARRCSVWVRRQGTWRMLFHQGTREA